MRTEIIIIINTAHLGLVRGRKFIMKNLKANTLISLVAFQVFLLITANKYVLMNYLSGDAMSAPLMFVFLNVGICVVFKYITAIVAHCFDNYQAKQKISAVKL